MKEEERRFLRALIPGVVFIVELCIVLLLILCESQKEGIYDLFKKTNNTDIILALILVFIGSGGIGYFLGIVYRFFYWNIWPLNSWKFLEFFIKNKKLELTLIPKPEELETHYFNRYGAWRIANVIFYSRKEESNCFKGAEGRNDRLVDYMHSSGTIITGYFAAIFIGICIGGISSFIKIKCLLLIVLFLIHLFEYMAARKNSLYFLKDIFLNELSSKWPLNEKVFRIKIVEEDLTNKNPFWFKIRKRCELKINDDGIISLVHKKK